MPGGLLPERAASHAKSPNWIGRRDMMVVLVGLDHRSAPIELRERVFIGDPDMPAALADLRALDLAEVAVLSTCNRFEVVALVRDVSGALRDIGGAIARIAGIPPEALRPHLYELRDQQAARHLFRVAAGLESLVLGETQIIRQVARADAEARRAGSTGPTLTRLFMMSLHVGKRARTETRISQHTLSISHAAAWLARRESGGLDQRASLIIGAGEMGSLAARALRQQGAARLTILSRTLASANRLADRLGAAALSWDQLEDALTAADVVIAAAGASRPIVDTEMVARVMSRRPEQPLTLVDIGVPRNLDERVGNLEGVHRFDIDDLRSIVAEHRLLREAEVAPVERIIAGEVRQFMRWQRSRAIVPVITSLRRQAQEIARTEVEQALRRMPALDEHDRAIVAQMADRIVNKLLHAPTITLKERAERGDHFDYSHATRKLFALDISGLDREPAEPDE
jgi:glutamyl-tRNA reductase